ncbi:MAG TPA: hypothetical protein VIS74_07540 [Chthoniobacterales bacterium]
MKKPFSLLLVLTSLTLGAFAQAQEPMTITVKKGDTINVAFKGLSGADAEAISKVLLNDLAISGTINVGVPERATYTISGTAGSASLQGSVADSRDSAVLTKTYTGNARSLAHQFADDIVETLSGKPGIANTKIAFASSRSGRKEIYLADYDGANVQQITRDNAISVAPALSADGSKLAYTGYQSGYADIYLVQLGSGARNRIVKFPGTNSGAAFSPDGSRIACTISKDGNPELYTVSASGGGARRLTRTKGVESSPTWSPDGREIIFTSDENGSPQLNRISSAGGSGTPISTGFGFCTEPSWSPDGRKVAFTVRSGGFSIAVKDLSGGPGQILVSGQDPVWGPNSRHLIYSTGSSLVLLDTQTRKTYPIISGLGQVGEPTWARK